MLNCVRAITWLKVRGFHLRGVPQQLLYDRCEATG